MTKQQWLKLIGKRKYCKKCNYEGFIRDHDGTWLRDCECVEGK